MRTKVYLGWWNAFGAFLILVGTFVFGHTVGLIIVGLSEITDWIGISIILVLLTLGEIIYYNWIKWMLNLFIEEKK